MRTPHLFLVDCSFKYSMVIELLVALPIFLADTLALLPYVKGSVIGIAWDFGVVRNPVPSGHAGD